MTGRLLRVEDLPLQNVDSQNPIPLYHQIEADLRRMIDSGALRPDDLLPPEVELSKAYGVGRHTIREALTRLAADNLIARKAGRGTVILAPPDRARFYLDRSFTKIMADLGLEAHSEVLNVEPGTIEQHLPRPLQQKCGASCFHLTRLRFGSGEPIGLQHTIIVTDLCPGIERFDFNRLSLYDVLASEYALVITRISHIVSAVTANANQAELLRVELGAPLLLVKTSAFLEDGQIIEFTTSCYRADRFEFSTTDTIEGV